MKNLYKLSLLCAVACILFSCSKDEITVDYLPVQVEQTDGWGFINAKGEIFLEDEYENRPSAVIEGVFSVKEGESYSLYQFDKKSPKLLLDELVYVGISNGGMIPVTKKDCRIEIVNTKGETLFTLDDIDGGQVISCDNMFRNDHLLIVVKKGYEERMGAVNRNGEVTIKPKYKHLIPLAEDLFWAETSKEANENDGHIKDVTIINGNGEKQKNWDLDDDCYLIEAFDDYLTLVKDDRIRVYNFKGEEVLKCKESVDDIYDIQDDKIIYRDKDGKIGVMDIKGERIMSPKFDHILFSYSGFYAKREGKDKIELYSDRGEKDETTDWISIYNVDGFGYLTEEESDNQRMGYQFIIDSEGEAVNKNDMFDISMRISLHKHIDSDYFSSEALADIMTDAIKSGLADDGITLGGLVSACQYKREEMADEGCAYNFAEDIKCKVKLTLVSDRSMRIPVIGQRTVQRFDLRYGYYTDCENYIDHYDVDPEARIEIICLSATCPSDKTEQVYNAVSSAFNKGYDKIADSCYKKGEEYIYVTKDDDSVSIFYSKLDLTPMAGGAAEE